jgi:hypothetical protein
MVNPKTNLGNVILIFIVHRLQSSNQVNWWNFHFLRFDVRFSLFTINKSLTKKQIPSSNYQQKTLNLSARCFLTREYLPILTGVRYDSQRCHKRVGKTFCQRWCDLP